MEKCKWCGGIFHCYKSPGLKPDWVRKRCKSCCYISYKTPPTPDQLDEIYLQAWQKDRGVGGFATGSTNTLISHSLIQSTGLNCKGLRCLDYGAGSGALSRVLISLGADVLCYEPYGPAPSDLASFWIQNQRELNAVEPFDLVFFVEVIEHAIEPVAVCRDINQLLKHGGKLIVTTPNSLGLTARLSGQSWRETENATHIGLFSNQALVQCLRQSGFVNLTRLKRPVRYSNSRIKSFFLSILQICGIDGGLRVIAEKK